VGALAPGLALSVAVAFAGRSLSQWLGTSVLDFKESPVSGIMVAILLGLAVRNLAGLPAVCDSGLQLCLKRVVRIGIVLPGLRLSLTTAGKIGLVGLPIVLGCIVCALIPVSVVNRALGLPRRPGSLIAVGTSICGASAIVATAPAIDAEEDEVSYAVGCITVFGLVTMFLYPFLAHRPFVGNPNRCGLFVGTAIHETAQVAGAGLMYEQQFSAPRALEIATVTKLVRNLCMAGVIPLMAVMYHRGSSGTANRRRAKWHQVVPLFIAGFIAMTGVRSLGDLGARPFFGLLDSSAWKHLISNATLATEWCLTVAMAAVGLGASLSKLKSLGWKPFGVGFAAAALVGVASIGLVRLFGPLI
jgi:uncharacterized integral membrane protein (TIGR00698 family)